jgi:hypothetical protein
MALAVEVGTSIFLPHSASYLLKRQLRNRLLETQAMRLEERGKL